MAKDWKAADVYRLQSALRKTKGKRLYVRLQTLLLLAQGKGVSEAASLMGVSRQVVHLWRERYWGERTAECLKEGVRSGRPRTDAVLSDEMILFALSLDPRTLGYRQNAWTVAVLSDHLNQRHATALSPATLRRRLKAMGLRYKRPKYVYEDKEPNRAQKGAIIRKLKGCTVSSAAVAAVVLMQDETIIRLFPHLRRSWSPQGVQAEVGVSGRNAQRTLSCALNLKTGAIVAQVQQHNNQQGFQTLLRAVRRRYGALPVYMLLDGFSAHRAKATIELASQLNIHLIELPKQCPELNAVDQLWRHVKGDISANRQYPGIDDHAKAALRYVKELSPKQRLTKAGVYANNFWLKNILSKNFCSLT